MNHWLHGMFTALVTPFAGEAIDRGALAQLVRWQIDQGADGVVLGTATGEHATLSPRERLDLLTVARAAAGPGFPIIAAVGSNDTAATLGEIRQATAAGASALLLRTPYYSRPSQDGFVAHARAAASATPLEIILDNDPDRCGIEISLPALEALGPTANIVAILERRGDIQRCDRIARIRDRRFMRLTGASDAIPAYLLAGGCGAVTSLGNLVPQWLARLMAAARSEFFVQAQTLQRRLVPLNDVLSREPDPVGTKLALSLLHPQLSPACRLPLVATTPAWIEELRQAVEDLPCPARGRAAAGPFLDAAPRPAVA